jgi:hypothetical protein
MASLDSYKRIKKIIKGKKSPVKTAQKPKKYLLKISIR